MKVVRLGYKTVTVLIKPWRVFTQTHFIYTNRTVEAKHVHWARELTVVTNNNKHFNARRQRYYRRPQEPPHYTRPQLATDYATDSSSSPPPPPQKPPPHRITVFAAQRWSLIYSARKSAAIKFPQLYETRNPPFVYCLPDATTWCIFTSCWEIYNCIRMSYRKIDIK